MAASLAGGSPAAAAVGWRLAGQLARRHLARLASWRQRIWHQHRPGPSARSRRHQCGGISGAGGSYLQHQRNQPDQRLA